MKTMSDGLWLGNYPAGLACPFYPLPCLMYQCFQYGHSGIEEDKFKDRMPGKNLTAEEKALIDTQLHGGVRKPLKKKFFDAFYKLTPLQREIVLAYHGFDLNAIEFMFLDLDENFTEQIIEVQGQKYKIAKI